MVSARDAFGMKDGICEKCVRHKEKMKAEQDPQLQATPKRAPAQRRNLSCVAVPTRLPDEQDRRRDKLWKVLPELKIELISVSDEMRHSLVAVLAGGQDAFAVDDNDVGHTTLIQHRIETGNSQPFREMARPVPYARRIFIERELNRLLRLGIIYEANPGECPYASPIVVVAKKDGTLRMCVDYRYLKQMTIKDAYHLPRIDEIFTSLHNAYASWRWLC